jgi:hypothetical protein
VAASRSRAVNLPNGEYQVYFRFSDEPDALYRGDDFSLFDASAELRLGGAVEGNYAVRRVD